MSEINVQEIAITPEKPNVLKNEQIEVYLPVASYNNAGAASFSDSDFLLDRYGNVQLRRSVVRAVANFDVDWENGVLNIVYDDGLETKIPIPTNTNYTYSRYNLATVIEFDYNAFSMRDPETGHWFALFGPDVTNFSDSLFVVSVEMKSTVQLENVIDSGYKTVIDTVYKGDDGSLLISVDEDDDRFDGRVVLIGGAIITDSQIVNITYDSTNYRFVVTKTDGSVFYIDTTVYVEQALDKILEIEDLFINRLDLPSAESNKF